MLDWIRCVPAAASALSWSWNEEVIPMPSEFAFLHMQTSDQVCTITLDRAPLNILTIEMIDELAAALAAAAADTHLRALVLRADGKAFCAGVDVADHVPARVEAMIRSFGRLFVRLRGFPAPTIAVVRGAALGGGTELALGCDLVLAGSSARFGQPEIKLGVFPPIAAAVFPQLVGYQQAARLIFTGETIPAEEAVHLGLATRVVPDDALPAELDALLQRFRGLSAVALRLAKRALLTGAELGSERGLEPIEHLYLADLMNTADAAEGLSAFMEKRPPVWRDA
jgi:cyclohexa-1,5-dienecarbonyl-CoA hydratase